MNKTLISMHLLRIFPPVVATLAVALNLSVFGQTASTDPVGFLTLNIQGTGGTKPSAVTFLGIGMARAVDLQGLADVVSGNVITSNNATWTDGQFASTPAPGYFLEVVSGPKAGLITQIVNSNQASKTLTVAVDLSAAGVENGVGFKIRRNWSLASLFGQNNEAGLGQGTSSTADIVAVYDPALGGGVGGYEQFYYSSGGLPGVGWRKIGAGSTNQADQGIWLDEALIVTRKQSSNISAVVTGAVKLGQTVSPVIAGSNFLGNVYPSGSLTLANSGLYSGSATTGVAGGTASTADLVLIYNPSLGAGAGGYDQYYYSTGGLPGIGWRKVGGGNTPQDSVTLDVGKAVVIKRIAGGSFSWVVPQPFPNL